MNKMVKIRNKHFRILNCWSKPIIYNNILKIKAHWTQSWVSLRLKTEWLTKTSSNSRTQTSFYASRTRSKTRAASSIRSSTLYNRQLKPIKIPPLMPSLFTLRITWSNRRWRGKSMTLPTSSRQVTPKMWSGRRPLPLSTSQSPFLLWGKVDTKKAVTKQDSRKRPVLMSKIIKMRMLLKWTNKTRILYSWKISSGKKKTSCPRRMNWIWEWRRSPKGWSPRWSRLLR